MPVPESWQACRRAISAGADCPGGRLPNAAAISMASASGRILAGRVPGMSV